MAKGIYFIFPIFFGNGVEIYYIDVLFKYDVYFLTDRLYN